MNVGSIISNAVQKGLKNFLPLLVNFILWALTVWIPYLNVGTTIGLVAIAAKMSKDQPISFTEIFDPKYRKRMGEFFLVSAFVGLGVSIGFAFLIIPGIVIGIAWSLAVLLVVDKDMDPVAAMNKSNQLTYGKKGTIFLGFFLVGLIVMAALGIVGGILSLFMGSSSMVVLAVIYGIIMMVLGVLAASVYMGAAAYVYGQLVK